MGKGIIGVLLKIQDPSKSCAMELSTKVPQATRISCTQELLNQNVLWTESHGLNDAALLSQGSSHAEYVLQRLKRTLKKKQDALDFTGNQTRTSLHSNRLLKMKTGEEKNLRALLKQPPETSPRNNPSHPPVT